ncbi:MAG: ABC transporter ATP-binding protein [Planctomycetota bacterium]
MSESPVSAIAEAVAAETAPSAPTAVQIAGLTHRYPGADRDALVNLNFAVRPGEAFALLGPNGGGKTTTFRVLATMLEPSGSAAAEVSVFGHSVFGDPAAARRELGVVFQSPSLDLKLTARENLACHARLYGLPRRDAAPRIDEALARFDLVERMHERVEAFSGGMRRKLEIAKALLHRPRLLLMDEPATGLDPAARRELWEHLRSLREQSDLTVAWTTHLMDEAEHADRLAVLRRGNLLTVQTPAELKASLGGHTVIVEPGDTADADWMRDRVDAALGPLAPGREPVVAQNAVRFEHPDGPAVVAQTAALFPDRLRRVSVGQPTLEDAYLRLTGDRSDPAEPATSGPVSSSSDAN